MTCTREQDLRCSGEQQLGSFFYALEIGREGWSGRMPWSWEERGAGFWGEITCSLQGAHAFSPPPPPLVFRGPFDGT